MADANNAESIQSKIQIARRDAEALKDRIKVRGMKHDAHAAEGALYS